MLNSLQRSENFNALLPRDARREFSVNGITPLKFGALQVSPVGNCVKARKQVRGVGAQGCLNATQNILGNRVGHRADTTPAHFSGNSKKVAP
jgi:hypothetical protein